MSRPPLNPEKTTAGIALDPVTLERVVPESRRPDGSVRKSLKIRPGFTPQEDVKRFRGTKQAQMDANHLPKGHIIGWTPPTIADALITSKPMSKGAKKNAKRKEKKDKERVKSVSKDEVPDNWEDDEDTPPAAADTTTNQEDSKTTPSGSKQSDKVADDLVKNLDKLKV
ncbi:hypothetical protein FA15DRAFT_633265 [Coprinopsis marcescibilis]|uniref:WIBG Mago-binding domain-containing protein n=1 Tax=Coprinopsis marcescibilis TaxID=230819 RepID=A0A5C3L722_COPMA|nr:hypothetical protein FA15DRAFT_633265 [Coprinopsis marcescibilis]